MSDVIYDDILGKMREGDDGSGGGGEYVPVMQYVTINNGEDTTVLVDVAGGTHATITDPVLHLVLSGLTASPHYEAEVLFTAGTGTAPIVDFPFSVSVIGNLDFAEGKSYIINVRDNMLVAAEYTPGVTV